MLEDPWVVKSKVISPLIWVITMVTLLITHLYQEPPSRHSMRSPGRGGM